MLRLLQKPDALDIYKMITQERLYLGQWLPFVAHTKTPKDTEAFVNATVDAPKERFEQVFTIRKHGTFIGLIGFKGTDHENRKTEIGYWLSESHQKQGIITLSVDRLCQYAFDVLSIKRIQIKCAVGNVRSKNVAKRLHFKLEGIERDGELLTGGKYTDLEVYSKLKKDLA